MFYHTAVIRSVLKSTQLSPNFSLYPSSLYLQPLQSGARLKTAEKSTFIFLMVAIQNVLTISDAFVSKHFSFL